MFVQTVQSKAEAALSVRCLTKSTVPKSFDTQTIIDGKGSTEMDVWSSVTIWTGDTLSAPLSNNQSTSKYELSVCNDYEMLY